MFEQLLTDLRHADPTIRYEAAQQLGASQDMRAVDPLINALPDDNSKVQYAAFSGLVKLGASHAAEAMIDMLVSDLNSRVWELLKLNIGLRLRSGLLDLVQPGDITIAQQVSATLQDSELALDDHQRAFFVRVLGRTADRERVDLLIKLLVKGSEPIQTAAAEALGWMGDERAVSPLLVFLNEEHDTLREAAAEALGRIGSDNAVTALIGRLNDSSEWVRRAAAEALGIIGDRTAIHPLVALLQDESTMVQDAAFEALKKLSYGSYDVTL